MLKKRNLTQLSMIFKHNRKRKAKRDGNEEGEEFEVGRSKKSYKVYMMLLAWHVACE